MKYKVYRVGMMGNFIEWDGTIVDAFNVSGAVDKKLKEETRIMGKPSRNYYHAVLAVFDVPPPNFKKYIQPELFQ
jgi:hypothetical protein